MTKSEQQAILYPGATPLCDPLPSETAPPKLTEIGWLEAEKAKHKKAFRVAFDFLESFAWPPENTVEYWKTVTDRMALLYSENKGNKLCELFLLAVTEYLGKIGEGVGQHGNGQSV